MNHGHTVESLINFETRVADAFKAGKIRAPVHLCSDGQAQPLLDIFREVQPEDWVFSTWRSHWHCLLKGVPEQEVFDAILAGRSMYLQFPKYNVFSSAIVGGILPIASGVAAGIKRRVLEFIESQKGKETQGSFPQFSVPMVWCFVGDMTARSGLFHEFDQYADGHELPIRVVVENNGLSTDTPTEEVWGHGPRKRRENGVWDYTYERNWPHVGISEFVQF